MGVACFIKAICVFVGSLSLFWARGMLEKDGTHFCPIYFHMHYFPFFATRNVHILVYFIQW
jgi:hypothetical protein